jgi:hypothetical protein
MYKIKNNLNTEKRSKDQIEIIFVLKTSFKKLLVKDNIEIYPLLLRTVNGCIKIFQSWGSH